MASYARSVRDAIDLIDETPHGKLEALFNRMASDSDRALAHHDALVKALNGMVEMYADMVNSGDCGFWDPEKVKEVIAARGALSLASHDSNRGDAQS